MIQTTLTFGVDMSSEPSVLRRVRGNAKGQVTRATQSATRMRAKSLKDYDTDTLDRYIAQATKADRAFTDAHQALYQADTSIDEDQYQDEEEEHQVAMDAFKKTSTIIKACIRAKALGDRLQISLQDLHGNLSAGYAPGMAPQYTAIQKELDMFRDAITQHGVSEHTEIADLRHQIMEHWYQVDQARTDAGYTPSTSTSGGPSTTAPSPY